MNDARTQQNNSTSAALFASFLAGERLTLVILPGAETASFNCVDRILTLPEIRSVYHKQPGVGFDVEDMFILHEVGHALFTPSITCEEMIKGWGDKNKSLAFGVLNIVEDVRIERLIQQKFGGARVIMKAGYKIVHNSSDLFQLKANAAAGPSQYTFIDRLNIHAKLVSRGIIDETLIGPLYVNDIEKKFASRAFQASGFDEVSTLSAEIFEYITILSENEEPQDVGQSEDACNSKTSTAPTFDDEDRVVEKKEKKSSTDSFNQDAKSPNPKTQTEIKTDAKISDILETMDERASYLRSMSKTVDYSQLLDRNHGYEGRSPYIRMVATDLDSDMEFPHAMHKTAKTKAAMLTQLFQQKKAAQAAARKTHHKSGRLDSKRLHAYRTSDDLFKQFTYSDKEQSHGMVFLIDFSISMKGKPLKSVIIKTLFLSMFCKMNKIPFEIYVFTSAQRFLINNKPADNCLMQIATSNMSSRIINRNLSRIYRITGVRPRLPIDGASSAHGFQMGCTPTSQALCHMEEVIGDFRKNSLVDIVNFICLTDGLGNLCFKDTHVIKTVTDNASQGAYIRVDDFWVEVKNPAINDCMHIRIDSAIKHVDGVKMVNLKSQTWLEYFTISTLIKYRHNVNMIGIFTNRSIKHWHRWKSPIDGFITGPITNTNDDAVLIAELSDLISKHQFSTQQ